MPNLMQAVLWMWPAMYRSIYGRFLLLLNPDTNLKHTSGQDPRPSGWLRRPGAQPDAGGAVDVARNVPQHLRPLPAAAKP